MQGLTRREAIALGIGSGAAALVGPQRALAAPQDAAELVATFTGGKIPENGSIAIDMPDSVEDGSSVPFSVVVDYPMQPDKFVSDVLVVAEANPRPAVATFHFTPLSGRAEAATRIRLAAAQDIMVIAKTADGRVFAARKHVQVTIGACTGS